MTGSRVDSEQTEANNAKRLKNIQQQVKNEMLKSEEKPEEKSVAVADEESPLKEDNHENAQEEF